MKYFQPVVSIVIPLLLLCLLSSCGNNGALSNHTDPETDPAALDALKQIASTDRFKAYYEDGLFKMWYGGGGGRMANLGWAYAVSQDGSNYLILGEGFKLKGTYDGAMLRLTEQ